MFLGIPWCFGIRSSTSAPALVSVDLLTWVMSLGSKYQNSCQSRFSGEHLVLEALQEKEFKKYWQFPISFFIRVSRFLRCFSQEWRISVFALSV